MTVMLSSQGIGLITVMVVSGCSVMLLVLGGQKLLEPRKDSAEDPKQEQEEGLGSLFCDSMKKFSVVSSTKHGGSISWRINLDIAEAFIGPQDCYRKTPNSAIKSQPSQVKKRNLVKKVRFSEDVVEPSGNNEEYRRRHALASQMKSQKAHNSEMVDSLTDNSEGSQKKVSPVNNQKCRMQTLAKPHMPPNRMALYNGIFHDRSQRALLH